MKTVGKIYSAVDADELEAGDIVFAGASLANIKNDTEVCELVGIADEEHFWRFETLEGVASLAKLVCPKKHADVYEAWKNGAKVEVDIAYGDWVPIEAPTWEEVEKYRIAEEKDPYAELKKAYAEGKVIQMNFGTTKHPDWVDWVNPDWTNPITLYRIKPESEEKDDPYAELKKAYEEGSTIQIHTKQGWEDIPEPYWQAEVEDYRVKPEPKTRRMTNRELAKWLAQGNGQFRIRDSTAGYSYMTTYLDREDKPVNNDVLIRAWDEAEWHEPLVEE